MRRFLLPLAALAVCVPALAHQQSGGEAGAGERRICKDVTRVGTRLNAKRYCLTRNEWDEVAWESRRVTSEFVERNRSAGSGNGNGKAPNPTPQ